MSIIRGSNYGRRYEQPHTQICDPFEDPEIRAALTSSHMAFPRETSSILHAQIEFKERPEAYVYTAHLPGLKPEEVIVEVEEDRVLCISGEKKVAKEEKKGRWHHVAQSSGHFVQRLSLPANVKVDQVKAYMDSGVLTVTVPKYEVANRHATRPRPVNISGH